MDKQTSHRIHDLVCGVNDWEANLQLEVILKHLAKLHVNSLNKPIKRKSYRKLIKDISQLINDEEEKL